MDQLIYLDKDISYRADRVDSYLTLFWEPHEFELVGFKLKGFWALFEAYKKVTEKVTDDDFIPFVKLFELAAFASWPQIAEEADATKVKTRYEKVKRFAENKHIRIRDMQLSAQIGA